MSKEETALSFVWVGTGIVFAFIAWTFVAPYLAPVQRALGGSQQAA